MKRSPPRIAAATLLVAVAAAACSTTSPTPAAGTARPATGTARPRYTEADVRFMQRMMAHHAQALVMTALVPARTARDDMRLLTQRIEVSQQGEIAQMRRWLQGRGEAVPSLDDHGADHTVHETAGHDSSVHHAAGHDTAGHHATTAGMTMPGMLTPAELAGLARATGPAFDQQFLRFMTRHHEGALAMVAEFFATPGAGQEPEIFDFASDVDADQRAEIARMRALQKPSPTPN